MFIKSRTEEIGIGKVTINQVDINKFLEMIKENTANFTVNGVDYYQIESYPKIKLSLNHPNNKTLELPSMQM